MAFVPSTLDQDDEELKKQQGGPQQIAGTETDGGQAAGAGGGVPNASPGATSKGYVDVASYLDANKDQTAKMAGDLGGQLTTGYNTIKSNIDKGGQDYRNQVDQGTTNYDQGLVDSAAQNPNEFVKDPNNVSKFTAQRTAQYKGPQDFSTQYGGFQNDVAQGQAKADLVNSESGRKQLLYDSQKNPTAGNVSLDQMLLGQDPNAYATLQGAAKQYGDLGSYLDTANQGATDYTNKAKANTQAAQQNTTDRFTGEGGVIPTFQAGVNKTLAADQKQYADEISAFQDPNYQRDVTLLNSQFGGKYPTINDIGEAPSLESAASSHDFETNAALQQLMGGQGMQFLPNQRTAGVNQWNPVNIPNLPPTPGTPLTPTTPALPPPPPTGVKPTPITNPLTKPGEPELWSPPVVQGTPGHPPPTTWDPPTPTGNSKVDRQNQDAYLIANHGGTLHGINLNDPVARSRAIETINANPSSDPAIDVLNNGIPPKAATNPDLVKYWTDELKYAKALARLGIIDASKLRNPDAIWT